MLLQAHRNHIAVFRFRRDEPLTLICTRNAEGACSKFGAEQFTGFARAGICEAP